MLTHAPLPDFFFSNYVFVTVRSIRGIGCIPWVTKTQPFSFPFKNLNKGLFKKKRANKKIWKEKSAKLLPFRLKSSCWPVSLVWYPMRVSFAREGTRAAAHTALILSLVSLLRKTRDTRDTRRVRRENRSMRSLC